MKSAARKAISAARFARGVTLIELIAFIVIASVVMIAMTHVFSFTSNGMAAGKKMTAATQAAQQRMEVILGQIAYLRSTVGYSGINATNYDPCPPVGTWSNQACSSGSSTVTSSASFSSNVCGAGTGANCFQITVSAIDANSYLSGPLVLTYQVSNY